MVGKKLKLEDDANGNTRYSVLNRVNIDLDRSKIDIFYTNYIRLPSGDVKLLEADLGGSVNFSHIDGTPFLDKNGEVIPERDENGEVIIEDGEPKPRLEDYTKYINVLDPMFSNPLARAIFRREALQMPENFEFLDEE